MITFKCGNCKMSFNVEESYLAERRSQRCSNCYAIAPDDLVDKVNYLLSENVKSDWKAYVIETKESKGEGTLTLY